MCSRDTQCFSNEGRGGPEAAVRGGFPDEVQDGREPVSHRRSFVAGQHSSNGRWAHPGAVCAVDSPCCALGWTDVFPGPRAPSSHSSVSAHTCTRGWGLTRRRRGPAQSCTSQSSCPPGQGPPHGSCSPPPPRVPSVPREMTSREAAALLAAAAPPGEGT